MSLKGQKNSTLKPNKKTSFTSLEKKLVAYSVAAGAAMSCIETANADSLFQDIVYKDITDVIVSQSGQPYKDEYLWDINEDGKIDFKIWHSSANYLPTMNSDVQFWGASNFAPTSNGFVGEKYKISKLNEGVEIDDFLPDGFIKRGNFGSLYMSNGNPQSYGDFLGVDMGYFGFRFTDLGGQIFDGWGRVSMPSDGSSITLTDYAYNRNHEGTIEVGQKFNKVDGAAAVPEPGTLGMLALGAAGVYSWKKKQGKNKTASA